MVAIAPVCAMKKPMLRNLPFVISLSLASAQAQQSIEPAPSNVVLHGAKDGRRTWHTQRLIIESTANIPPHELTRLATVADSTVQAVSAHPLPLFHPPDGERLRIVILHDDSSYVAEGGQLGSAGMYLWRKQCVILHAQHLFPTKPGSRLNPSANEALVVHEISHLCMHGVQGRMPQWLNEGLCEYFAASHRGGGRFRFDTMEQAIRQHLQSRFERGNPMVKITPVSDLADLDSRQWSRYLDRLPLEDRHCAYATALLLTHYHLHGGPDRRKRIAQALERKRPSDPDPFTILWSQSADIQNQWTSFWRPKGLQFTLLPESPLPPSVGGPDRESRKE